MLSFICFKNYWNLCTDETMWSQLISGYKIDNWCSFSCRPMVIMSNATHAKNSMKIILTCWHGHPPPPSELFHLVGSNQIARWWLSISSFCKKRKVCRCSINRWLYVSTGPIIHLIGEVKWYGHPFLVYRPVHHLVTLGDYRTMNIMVNFAKVIVQRLENCVTSYAWINPRSQSEDRFFYTLHKNGGYHKSS